MSTREVMGQAYRSHLTLSVIIPQISALVGQEGYIFINKLNKTEAVTLSFLKSRPD